MMFTRHFYFLLFIGFICFISSCGGDEDPNPDNDLGGYLEGVDNLGAPPVPYDNRLESEEDFSKTVDGVDVNCTRKKYSFCKNYEDIITSNPNDQAIFPGNLVRGDGIRDGLLTSVSGVERAEMNYTVLGDNSTIAVPTLSEATSAVNRLISESSKTPDAKIAFQMKEVYTSEQALGELGIDYNLITTQVKSSLGGSLSQTKSHVYMYFKQVYYTVVVEYPQRASGFFGPDVTPDDLGAQVSSSSPLCYIASVSYGRSFIAHFSSSSSLSNLKSALDVGFKVVDVGVSFETNSVLEETDVDLVFLGGSSEDASRAVAIGTPSALYDFMVNGSIPDVDTRLTPIGYIVRHIKDNSYVKTGSPVEYTVEECDFDNGSQQKLKLSEVGIEIIEDCDFWGPGEFYYTFQINDDAENALTDVYENDRANPIEKSDGEWIDVDVSDFFYAPVGTDAYVEMTVNIEQQQSSGSYELVGKSSKKHYSPYNDLNSFTILLESDSDCSANFHYTLSKD